MSWDNLLAPPPEPFYEERKKKQRRSSSMHQHQNPEWQELKRKEYEAELSKPVAHRIGKLKTRADYTPEEWARLKQLYQGKKR